MSEGFYDTSEGQDAWEDIKDQDDYEDDCFQCENCQLYSALPESASNYTCDPLVFDLKIDPETGKATCGCCGEEIEIPKRR